MPPVYLLRGLVAHGSASCLKKPSLSWKDLLRARTTPRSVLEESSSSDEVVSVFVTTEEAVERYLQERDVACLLWIGHPGPRDGDGYVHLTTRLLGTVRHVQLPLRKAKVLNSGSARFVPSRANDELYHVVLSKQDVIFLQRVNGILMPSLDNLRDDLAASHAVAADISEALSFEFLESHETVVYPVAEGLQLARACGSTIRYGLLYINYQKAQLELGVLHPGQASPRGPAFAVAGLEDALRTFNQALGAEPRGSRLNLRLDLMRAAAAVPDPATKDSPAGAVQWLPKVDTRRRLQHLERMQDALQHMGEDRLVLRGPDVLRVLQAAVSRCEPHADPADKLQQVAQAVAMQLLAQLPPSRRAAALDRFMESLCTSLPKGPVTETLAQLQLLQHVLLHPAAVKAALACNLADCLTATYSVLSTPCLEAIKLAAAAATARSQPGDDEEQAAESDLVACSVRGILAQPFTPRPHAPNPEGANSSGPGRQPWEGAAELWQQLPDSPNRSTQLEDAAERPIARRPSKRPPFVPPLSLTAVALTPTATPRGTPHNSDISGSLRLRLNPTKGSPGPAAGSPPGTSPVSPRTDFRQVALAAGAFLGASDMALAGHLRGLLRPRPGSARPGPADTPTAAPSPPAPPSSPPPPTPPHPAVRLALLRCLGLLSPLQTLLLESHAASIPRHHLELELALSCVHGTAFLAGPAPGTTHASLAPEVVQQWRSLALQVLHDYSPQVSRSLKAAMKGGMDHQHQSEARHTDPGNGLLGSVNQLLQELTSARHPSLEVCAPIESLLQLLTDHLATARSTRLPTAVIDTCASALAAVERTLRRFGSVLTWKPPVISTMAALLRLFTQLLQRAASPAARRWLVAMLLQRAQFAALAHEYARRAMLIGPEFEAAAGGPNTLPALWETIWAYFTSLAELLEAGIPSPAPAAEPPTDDNLHASGSWASLSDMHSEAGRPSASSRYSLSNLPLPHSAPTTTLTVAEAAAQLGPLMDHPGGLAEQFLVELTRTTSAVRAAAGHARYGLQLQVLRFMKAALAVPGSPFLLDQDACNHYLLLHWQHFLIGYAAVQASPSGASNCDRCLLHGQIIQVLVRHGGVGTRAKLDDLGVMAFLLHQLAASTLLPVMSSTTNLFQLSSGQLGSEQLAAPTTPAVPAAPISSASPKPFSRPTIAPLSLHLKPDTTAPRDSTHAHPQAPPSPSDPTQHPSRTHAPGPPCATIQVSTHANGASTSGTTNPPSRADLPLTSTTLRPPLTRNTRQSPFTLAIPPLALSSADPRPSLSDARPLPQPTAVPSAAPPTTPLKFQPTYDLEEDLERLLALEDEMGRSVDLDVFSDTSDDPPLSPSASSCSLSSPIASPRSPHARHMPPSPLTPRKPLIPALNMASINTPPPSGPATPNGPPAASPRALPSNPSRSNLRLPLPLPLPLRQLPSSSSLTSLALPPPLPTSSPLPNPPLAAPPTPYQPPFTSHPQLRRLVLELILQLLLTPDGTLDPRYCPPDPTAAGLPNTLFILHTHLATPDPTLAPLGPQLQQACASIGPAAARLLRLLAPGLFGHALFKGLREIGHGQHATVYEAQLNLANCSDTVIIKAVDTPRTPLDSAAPTLDTFNEVSILERLAPHPAICKIFDYGHAPTPSPSYWLVLQHYRCTLRKWRSATFPPGLPPTQTLTFLRIFLDIVNAAGRLAASNVVHHDLKCDNVLLEPLQGVTDAEFWTPPDPEQDPPFRVVLADFGESVLYPDLRGAQPDRSRGTAAFMSPEMVAAAPAEQKRQHRSFDRRKQHHAATAHDVWSLGCLLFELLTDRLLFAGECVDPGRFDPVALQVRVMNGLPGTSEVLTAYEKSLLGHHQPLINLFQWLMVRDAATRPTLSDLHGAATRLLASETQAARAAGAVAAAAGLKHERRAAAVASVVARQFAFRGAAVIATPDVSESGDQGPAEVDSGFGLVGQGPPSRAGSAATAGGSVAAGSGVAAGASVMDWEDVGAPGRLQQAGAGTSAGGGLVQLGSLGDGAVRAGTREAGAGVRQQQWQVTPTLVLLDASLLADALLAMRPPPAEVLLVAVAQDWAPELDPATRRAAQTLASAAIPFRFIYLPPPTDPPSPSDLKPALNTLTHALFHATPTSPHPPAPSYQLPLAPHINLPTPPRPSDPPVILAAAPPLLPHAALLATAHLLPAAALSYSHTFLTAAKRGLAPLLHDPQLRSLAAFAAARQQSHCDLLSMGPLVATCLCGASCVALSHSVAAAPPVTHPRRCRAPPMDLDPMGADCPADCHAVVGHLQRNFNCPHTHLLWAHIDAMHLFIDPMSPLRTTYTSDLRADYVDIGGPLAAPPPSTTGTAGDAAFCRWVLHQCACCHAPVYAEPNEQVVGERDDVAVVVNWLVERAGKQR